MAIHIRRREFVALLGGGVAWPIAAHVQQSAMPVIGLLSGSSTNAIPHLVTALWRGLEDNGFVEGQNLAMDQRWADGQFDRLPSMAAELVRRQVALIIALGPPSALAAKAATATIPMGLVASLNRPGGNATGVNLFTQALEPKKLDVLTKLVPTATTFGYLSNPNTPGAKETANEIRDAARARPISSRRRCEHAG